MGFRFPRLELLTLLALNWAGAQVSPFAEQAAMPKGVLFLEPCSTAVPGGKATLTVGVLTRRAETYVGEYKLKVSPYFFKNESGKLSIDVSDETLKKLDGGAGVEFSGQATRSGDGKTRQINGNATPLDPKQGTVKLRFMAGTREMLFNTSYRFDEPTEQRL
jgi:hypothetical protein